MLIRRFIMEDWLGEFKDTCTYNLGESGIPDITVGDLLARCGETTASLSDIVLKDNDTRGTERLRQAIAGTYGSTITYKHITTTTGTSEALFVLFNLLLTGGRNAVVPFPSFQALYEVPRATGSEVRFYRLTPDNGYVPDPDEVADLIDDHTGVVVVNTPHNPSGVSIPPETAEAITKTAERHGANVLFDEHYRFLPHRGEAPCSSFADPARGVLATGSITKCFGVIGLRMGWIVAPPDLIEPVRDFRDYLTHTLSPLSDYLACRAIEERKRFIPHTLEILRSNTCALASFIERHPGWSWTAPDAGVVSFPRFPYPHTTEAFARGLLKRHSVFVLPGSAFETKQHIRINLGLPPTRFREALGLLSEYCKTLEQTQ